LGLQIKQDRKGIYVHQHKYTKELLKKFKLEGAKPMKTPMHASNSLSKGESGKPVDKMMYRGLITHFCIWLLVDLILCLCARF